jgi:hypothetical protein
MNLQHKVQINVARKDGSQKKAVIKSGISKIPQRLLNFLFGEFTEILVLTPGQSVQSVEIHEIGKGGAAHEPNQTAS